MSDVPSPSPEKLGVEDESRPKEITRENVLEILRTYELPDDYMSELGVLVDLNELISMASLWIQEEGNDLDEFLVRIGAQ